MSGIQHRWLLIGNSRWHWALATDRGLQVEHAPPAATQLEPALLNSIVGWAAVGPVPPFLSLPPQLRLGLDRVPLADLPPWLGLDRALAGWSAWRQQGQAVLVADAGTVLSLTRIGASGRFAGGRLLAGVALQLRAMAAGTAALPQLELPLINEPTLAETADNDWPLQTRPAMVAGVVQGLAAAVADAALQAQRLEPCCRLVLSGGDGPQLLPRLQELLGGQGLAVELHNDLALRALVELQPSGIGGF